MINPFIAFAILHNPMSYQCQRDIKKESSLLVLLFCTLLTEELTMLMV